MRILICSLVLLVLLGVPTFLVVWIFSKDIKFAVNWTSKFLKVIIPGIVIIACIMIAIRLFSDFVGEKFGNQIEEIGLLTYLGILGLILIIIYFFEKRKS